MKDLLYGRAGCPGGPRQARPGRRAAPAPGRRPRRRRSSPRRWRRASSPARLGAGCRVARPLGGAGPARPHARCRWSTGRRTSAPAARTTARRAVPEGSLVGAGIGCSALASFMPEEHVGDVIGLTQMGGEGRRLDRHGAVRRAPPSPAEPRRRHVPPLREPGDPRRGRRRLAHHLQAAVQRRRRHDRWPAGGGRDGDAGARGRVARPKA